MDDLGFTNFFSFWSLDHIDFIKGLVELGTKSICESFAFIRRWALRTV